MAVRFPPASELGGRRSVHEVRLFSSNAASMLPAVLGLLSAIVGGVAVIEGSPFAGLRFLILGGLLVLLTVWLMRRRLRRGPACAVYEGGLAIREGGEIRWLPFGSFSVQRVNLRGITTGLMQLTVASAGRVTSFHVDQVRAVKDLAEVLEAALTARATAS